MRAIITTRHWNDVMGKYTNTFHIEGSGEMLITRDLLEELGVTPKMGATFTLYPLRLRIVGEPLDFIGQYYTVELDGWRAALIQHTHGLWVWLDKTYRRIIWTLAIWDLAVLPESEIASWRCIKLFRRKKE